MSESNEQKVLEKLEEIETKQLVLYEMLKRIEDHFDLAPTEGYDFKNASVQLRMLYINAIENRKV